MLIRILTIHNCSGRNGRWTDGELQVLVIAEQMPFIDYHFIKFYFIPREFLICCPFRVHSYINTNLLMSSDRSVKAIALMRSKIRQGHHEKIVSETLGPIKYGLSPMTIEFIPVNEPALGTKSATSEVIHTFNVMQCKDGGTFISHGTNQNPIMNCAKPLSDLSLVEMKYHENSIDGDEFVAQLCLDSTEAFLATPTYTGQLDMSKFDHKYVYTIKGSGLEFLLSPRAKTMSLQELNDIYQCHRIANGESTQVSFNELNHKDSDWLQLDKICVSVFFACKR